MKKNYKNKILGMSAAAAMLLSSSAYAGKIITDTDTQGWNELTQYGFGGWNLENVVVNITSDQNFSNIIYGDIFPDPTSTDGSYPTMDDTMSFESIISVGGEERGKLHGKDWPVGEPTGIKIINGDLNTHNGKPENCIMTTSYLAAEDNGGINGYLDSDTPAPTTCSSPFQTHKRFKVNMTENTVVDHNTTTGYGKPVELVFNLDPTDESTENTRYQVFQKINNYTGKRLEGYKIEVLDENGTVKPDDLTLSIGLLENPKATGDVNIWDVEDMANFSHGLWGPKTYEEPEPHFPTDGFFDSKRAGFVVAESGHGTPELVGGPDTLGSNYEALFGMWLPSKWQPIGIFFDDDNDPTTDAELVAFWGTVPNAPEGTAPAWHKGKDYVNDANSWAEPSPEELLTWMTDPLYAQGNIEDTLNLGLNYIVNVGKNSNIGDTFTIRITPRVAADQTAPNYIMDDNVTYIMPSTDYNGTDTHLVISPAPYFNLDTNLSVGVADTNVTGATDSVIDEVIVVLTASNGDEENLTLTETDVNSSIYVGTIATDTNTVATQDTIVNVVNGTVVTATYKGLTAETTATDGIVTPPVTDPDLVPSSGGGGCTYNPDSKHFDMMFLVMMALGLFYPFRRRFIK
ncbi:choice-of-anchor F family protein [Sulfurovum sp. XGS-02]|uniref:choice-of-anchor F family protein n=1 Tax=Sulfurovum sp. XGS-02 TaxID=2925411 RepID=UPI00204EE6F6|nr:choice-of-anchor F family protein [Sulfurovum sp. XGS-02]UPT76567.1 choice-of-anchor F family protein [Sulfurovum sp. XGS-02]